MKRRIPPALETEAYRVLVNALGAYGGITLAGILLLVMTFDWFSSFIYEKLGGWRLFWIFPVLVLILWLKARHYRAKLQAIIREITDPPPAQGLISFLSRLHPQQQDLLKKALDGGLDLEGLRSSPDLQKLPWRMNIEAIAYHLPRLKAYVVVPSHESAGLLALFDRLIRAIFPQARFRRLDLPPPWEGGVPYLGNTPRLAEAVEAAYGLLQESAQLPPTDILLDITSGTALATAAGIAVTLAEGRRIQYVDGQRPDNIYRVLLCDISYEGA
ncbi:MAG: hypothetical protein D6819_08980 [Gammaproteobacteria bacterium]|nr:MAG: hypothetical protein D6819_08980 [Gammaproteobacteria bacterium]